MPHRSGDPQKTVLDFLRFLETRDLESAAMLTAPDFKMQFPGSGVMTDFADLLDWAKDRYSAVGKTIEDISTSRKGPDTAIVYCHGTLSGTRTDGSSFDGIRFIDRFELRNGRICRQDVWNDLALHPQPFDQARDDCRHE